MALVLIEPKIKSKFVLVKAASEVTQEDITEFLESWSSGDATKYGMTDEVTVEDETATAEELWWFKFIILSLRLRIKIKKFYYCKNIL